MAKILLVEDDQGLVEELEEHLSNDGHAIDSANDGAAAIEHIKSFEYELVVLDVELPDTTGVELCQQFRKLRCQCPILMLTGRSEIDDKERGLDAGADDYLTKPFSWRELSARIRALLRRPAAPIDNKMLVRDLVIDTTTKKVTRGDLEIKILPKEYAILVFLLRHPNQVFDADRLLDRVWPLEESSSTEAVRQCIKRLREKIDREGERSIITTIKGFGYTIRENGE